MKKNIYLLILPFLLFSCFEEEPVSGFMIGTTWAYHKSGSIFANEKYLYSYMETYTLTFTETTFTYALNRKETNGGKSPYEDKLDIQIEGTYTVKYPNVYLSSDTYQKTGRLSVTSSGMGILVIDSEEQDRSLSLIKK
ncbi:MAG: hypothetical protein LBB84_11330 [Tannerellaceae bacterium]|jgi:hypothetical protein|nr:hypothetical protein [Tannerellaceae bacterium]